MASSAPGKPRVMAVTSFKQGAEAHNELYGTKIKSGHVLMCSRDFQYQQFDITPDTYDKYKKTWWDRVEEYYIKHAV